jgi:uncharacterized protein YwgA
VASLRKLEDLSVEDFILLLLSGIKKLGNLDSLTGRTMVQKVTYLLTKNTDLRESWGLNYFIHYYGPYSPEVTEASENLTTFRLVKEVPFETASITRYDLRITPEGEKLAKEIYDTLGKSSKEVLAEMTKEADKLNRTQLERVIERAYEQAKAEGLL